jgi:two-component system, NarL family, sensor kinase
MGGSLLNLEAKYSSLAVGETLTYQVQRAGRRQEVPVILQRYPFASKVGHNWSLVLFILEFIVLAVYVFARRPNDPAAQAALLVAACAICAAPLWMSGLEVADLVTTAGSWRYLLGETADAMTWAASLHFVLIFPRPRPLLTRYPWLAGSIYAIPLILFVVQLTTLLPASSDLVRLWVSSLLLMEALVYPIIVLIILVCSYWIMDDAVSRQQWRWFAISLGTGVSLYLGIWTVPMQVLRYPLLPWGFQFLVFLPVPVAVAIAILRYQAFDIKIVINRALVYGLFTICVVATFETTVGLIGMVFEKQAGFIIALIITVLLTAILFDPLRERLQDSMNRLLYGEHIEPYHMLPLLSQCLETARTPAEVPMVAVETVTQALHVPYVAIELKGNDGFFLAAADGQPTGELLRFPLTYQGETIGWLMLTSRGSTETFSLADQHLLATVGRQVGVAIHAARLTANLQCSQQPLVTFHHHGDHPSSSAT